MPILKAPLGLVALAADPTGTAAGQVYWNTASGKVRVFDGATWGDLSGTAAILATALEALADGDLVNVVNVSGAKGRQASAASAGLEATGYVMAAVAVSGVAVIFTGGVNSHASGLTPGPLFLSTTPGQASATPPSASGQVHQRIGTASLATTFAFIPGPSYVLL